MADISLSQEENPVRKAVEAFYSAFNDGFSGPCEFAAEDWDHINPLGGWTHGRENVLKEVREVHTTFLKNVCETIEEMSVRFAGREAAVVTVISLMSSFIMPDGIRHENEHHIRMFVVVKRGGRWLVIQDQNTAISNSVFAKARINYL